MIDMPSFCSIHYFPLSIHLHFHSFIFLVLRLGSAMFVSEKAKAVCSEKCSSDGCWGPGEENCMHCKHYRYKDSCLNKCSDGRVNSTEVLYPLESTKGELICGLCHSECAEGCHGDVRYVFIKKYWSNLNS